MFSSNSKVLCLLLVLLFSCGCCCVNGETDVEEPLVALLRFEKAGAFLLRGCTQNYHFSMLIANHCGFSAKEMEELRKAGELYTAACGQHNEQLNEGMREGVNSELGMVTYFQKIVDMINEGPSKEIAKNFKSHALNHILDLAKMNSFSESRLAQITKELERYDGYLQTFFDRFHPSKDPSELGINVVGNKEDPFHTLQIEKYNEISNLLSRLDKLKVTVKFIMLMF
eukprot:m.206986 g.206986  ORF g.206986 m.206986 type:complete len:227 (+) comp13759_c1_seq9:26-706(+)